MTRVRFFRGVALLGACPTTGKVQYENHGIASHAARGICKAHGIRMYAYRCPHCRTWHLASRRKHRRKARRKWRLRPVQGII